MDLLPLTGSPPSPHPPDVGERVPLQNPHVASRKPVPVRPGILPLQSPTAPTSLLVDEPLPPISPSDLHYGSSAQIFVPQALCSSYPSTGAAVVEPSQRLATCARPPSPNPRPHPLHSKKTRGLPHGSATNVGNCMGPGFQGGSFSSVQCLHPVLASFFHHSPQAVFVLSAKPLWGSISRRNLHGKLEDPEEQSPLPKVHSGTWGLPQNDFGADFVYPGVTEHIADAGREYDLSQLLRPKYVNPVAKKLASDALELHPDQFGESKNLMDQFMAWDMLELFAYQDLSRWLTWLRDVLKGNLDVSSSFQTEIQTVQKRNERWRRLREKGNIQAFESNSTPFTPKVESNSTPFTPKVESNSTPFTPKVASDAFEIIMTVSVVDNATPEKPQSHLRLHELSESHVLVFSAIILRRPTHFHEQLTVGRLSGSPLVEADTESWGGSNISLSNSIASSRATVRGEEEMSRAQLVTTSSSIPNLPYRAREAVGVFGRGADEQKNGSKTSDFFLGPVALDNWEWLEEREARQAVKRASCQRRKKNPSSQLNLPVNSSIPLNRSHLKPSGLFRDTAMTDLQLADFRPLNSRNAPSRINSNNLPALRCLGLTSEDKSLQASKGGLVELESTPAEVGLHKDGSKLMSEKKQRSSATPTSDQAQHDFCQNKSSPTGDSIYQAGAEAAKAVQSTKSSFLTKSTSPSATDSAVSSFYPQQKEPSPHSVRHTAQSDDGVARFCESLMSSPMGHMIVEHDWHNTAIGPIKCWSPTLKSMVGLILSSPYRMSLLWGEECVMLYNDAYVKTCGRKHPNLLGKSGAKGWAELWSDLGEVATSVLKGEVYTVYDSLLFFDRDPENPLGLRKEECYHSFSWVPVRGPTGKVEGIFNPSFETTSRVIAERRLGTLRDVVQITLMSKNRHSYEQGCLACISRNPYDLPFVILYTCESKNCSKQTFMKEDDSLWEDLPPGRIALQLSLAGTVAVPPGHSSASERLDIHIEIPGKGSQQNLSPHSSSVLPNGGAARGSPTCSSAASQRTLMTQFDEDENNVWPLQEACTLRKPIYISDLGTRSQGFEMRGWKDDATSAVIMPVTTSEHAIPLAVIIFGLSPRLYWSEAYALFLNLLTRQFSTGLSTVVSHEKEAQRLQALGALDRAKTTFFTNISHELRTPLTLIVGPISEILQSQRDVSPAAWERLKVVERNTQRLINLVNQLLDLSRFEAGKMVASFRSTDLSSLTRELAALFRSGMTKNQLELTVECPETDARVWVDQNFIEKVIFNLLSNSMKFTPSGGQVVIRVHFDTSKCYLSCSDTGVGIRPADLPRIFERFHRVEGGRKAEGTGIGLSLVQDIVKLHHGHLEVKSELDRGSKFIIALPLGTAHLPADSLDHSAESAVERVNDRVMASNARRWILGDVEPIKTSLMTGSPKYSVTTSSRGSLDSLLTEGVHGDILSTVGSSVLIADDNEDMREFLKSVLSRYFMVMSASNGLEALQMAKTHQPDIVVSDVMMPVMDGFQLLRNLKTDSATEAISVILLSARAGSEIRIEGLAEGADDYLVKPFDAKELVARINKHLQLHRLRQRLEKAVAVRTELLKENEQKYRVLYHTFEAISMRSPVGIIRWNVRGQITFANKAFCSQCELRPGDLLTTWTDQISSVDRERVRKELDTLFGKNLAMKGEFRWVGGSWCLYELSPYFQDDDQLAGFLGSTTDVTKRKEEERKQIEAAEARARDAEESKRQQEAFIDMTSHEIRNPLHGIHQAADLLNSSLNFLYDSLNKHDLISGRFLAQFRSELEEDIDAVESIQLCASHQSRIADDIINVSKLSMGLLTTVKTDFDLVGRVQEVLSMYHIEAQQKDVNLQLQVGPGLHSPQHICADPNRLAQVTINFLSNALRYTSSQVGERMVTVRVDIFTTCPEPCPGGRRIGDLRPEVAEAGDNLVYAQVGVQDTARGLSADELAKLFARFAQVNPTQDQYGGSGLGLYVSHRLIENHGGFIEVVSVKGEGSIFSFVIPAKRGRPSHVSNSPGFPTEGLSRVTKQHMEVSDMQPAATLLPAGSFPVTGGMPNRLPAAENFRFRHFSPSKVQEIEHSTGTTKADVQTAFAQKISDDVARRNSSEDTSTQKTHVLVVEDNMINIKVIKRQLTLKGYLVSVAMDGRKALDIIYADASKMSDLPQIDMVLMDIQMPVMDGLEAIKELRSAEEAGKICKRYPVIAVTGNARKEQTEQCLSSGFDDICVKPYKIDQVQKCMENLLAAYRLKPSR